MHVKQSMVLDAAENAFFLRQLEFIESQSYQVDYPELKAERLIPTDSNFAPGAATLTYRQFNRVGKAKTISDKSKKLPRVDIHGEEFPAAVRPLGDSFGYSIYEIKGAAMAQFPLEQERANAAREAVLRHLEEIAAIGEAETGLQGLLNHSAVNSTSAPNGAGGTATWSTKTPQEILADMNLAVQSIRDQTLGVEAPDTVLLPEVQYTIAAQTPIGDNSDKTILNFFLSSNPWIRAVESWHYLSTAGAGSTARLMAYRRDPSKVKLRNPHGYEQLPPQLEGLEYIVNCHMSTAGVNFYKPLSAYCLDGI